MAEGGIESLHPPIGGNMGDDYKMNAMHPH